MSKSTQRNRETWPNQRKQIKSPEINFKETVNYELPDKEFKIIVTKKLKDLQENADR